MNNFLKFCLALGIFLGICMSSLPSHAQANNLGNQNFQAGNQNQPNNCRRHHRRHHHHRRHRHVNRNGNNASNGNNAGNGNNPN